MWEVFTEVIVWSTATVPSSTNTDARLLRPTPLPTASWHNCPVCLGSGMLVRTKCDSCCGTGLVWIRDVVLN